MPLLPGVPRQGDRSHYGCIVWKMSAWRSSHQGVSSSIVRLQMPAGCRFSARAAAILPRKPHRVARRIDCDAEALLPGACRGAWDLHNGLPFSAPLVQCAARSAAHCALRLPPPKQRSRSDTSVAGKYPIATYSPSPTPAPDTQKPQPPRECGDCGIAQTRAQHRPQATAA